MTMPAPAGTTRPSVQKRPTAHPANLSWEDAMGLAALREDLRRALDTFSMPADPPPCGPGFFVVEYWFGSQLRIAIRTGSTCAVWHDRGRLVRWAPLRVLFDVPAAPPPSDKRPPWCRPGGRKRWRNG